MTSITKIFILIIGIIAIRGEAFNSSNDTNLPRGEAFNSSNDTDLPRGEAFNSSNDTDLPRGEAFNSSNDTDLPRGEAFNSSNDTDLSRGEAFNSSNDTNLPRGEAFNSSNDTDLPSGKALNSSNDDTDLPRSRVSDRDLLDTLESINLVSSFVRPEKNCDGIIGFFGCITIDRRIINPLGLDSGIRPKRESIDIMNTGIEHGIRRERQQALVKTKGSDDEPNSVMSLSARSMIRNKSRRSAPIPEKSYNKNTTIEVDLVLEEIQPPSVTEEPEELMNVERLFLLLLNTLRF